MSETPEQDSQKDPKARRAAGVIVFVLACWFLAVVLWHIATPAKTHAIGYDDAVKQIADGNVQSAKLVVSQADADVTLELRNSEVTARLTIPRSSITDLTGKLNNAGASIAIIERSSHGMILFFLNLAPLLFIFGIWFAIGFLLMKKRRPATPS